MRRAPVRATVVSDPTHIVRRNGQNLVGRAQFTALRESSRVSADAPRRPIMEFARHYDRPSVVRI